MNFTYSCYLIFTCLFFSIRKSGKKMSLWSRRFWNKRRRVSGSTIRLRMHFTLPIASLFHHARASWKRERAYIVHAVAVCISVSFESNVVLIFFVCESRVYEFFGRLSQCDHFFVICASVCLSACSLQFFFVCVGLFQHMALGFSRAFLFAIIIVNDLKLFNLSNNVYLDVTSHYSQRC